MNIYTFISWQLIGLVHKDVVLSSSRQAWIWIRAMQRDDSPFIVLIDGVPFVWDLDGVQ